MRKKEPVTPDWQRQERTMTLEGEPVLSYVLSWPEAAGCPRLTRYYRRAARLWRARWERRLYPLACLELADCRARSRPFRPWNCELSGSAPWETEERASIVLTARETGGSGRSRLVTRGAVWRLRDGTPLPLSSVLPPEYRKQKVLLAALNRAAEECRRGGDILLDDDLKTRLHRLVDRQNFWLEENAAAFPLLQCAAAPAAEGCPVLRIPLPPPGGAS